MKRHLACHIIYSSLVLVIHPFRSRIGTDETQISVIWEGNVRSHRDNPDLVTHEAQEQ